MGFLGEEVWDGEKPQGDRRAGGESEVRGLRRSVGQRSVGLLEGQPVGPQGQSPGVGQGAKRVLAEVRR